MLKQWLKPKTIILNHKEIGRIGELNAEKYLKSKKYSLIAKNWICKFGEIDLIFKKNNTFVFIEVKTRKHSPFAKKNIFTNITYKKQKKLLFLTQIFINNHLQKYPNPNIRIDVIGVILNFPNMTLKNLTHIKGAIGYKD